MIGPPISTGKQPPCEGSTSMRNMIQTPADSEAAQTTAPQTKPNSPKFLIVFVRFVHRFSWSFHGFSWFFMVVLRFF